MACIIIKERGYETLNVPLSDGGTTLGRAKTNTVSLKNKFVSGSHCEIRHKSGNSTVIDLESTNGLFVNGRRVKKKKLEDGDKILAGTALIIYVADENAFSLKNSIRRLRKGPVEDRELAASLLGQLGSAAAAGALVAALRDDPSRGVKAAAAEALGLLGCIEAARDVLLFFGSPDSAVRKSAALALIRLADPDTVEGIAGYLRHTEKAVRVLAANTLGRIHSKKSTEKLIGALGDEAFAVREAAIKALGDLADPAAGDALMRASADTKRFPQVWVIEALGKIGRPKSLRIILDAVKSPDAEVREAAADALGKLRAKKAVPALLAALDDPNPRVCESAADSLERLRHHLEMTESLAGSRPSSERQTVEISSIGEAEDVATRRTPKFGLDRPAWEKWWAGHAPN